MLKIASQIAEDSVVLAAMEAVVTDVVKTLIDEMGEIVKVVRQRVLIQNRITKMKSVKNCFSGAELVEELIHQLDCGRIKAVEIGKQLARCFFPNPILNADEVFDERPSRNRVKKMNKLALKRAKDWRKRVQFLTDRILELKSDEFVADVSDEKMVQMTPTDFCFVVKWVGRSSWQRALEVYEWLNLRRWYAPNARMLATILSVLGKANQEGLAVEMYTRVLW